VNLSDIAAMAGTPVAAVVALVVPPDRPGMADRTMTGLATAASRLGCPIVGADTSSGPALTVAGCGPGSCPEAGPVLRSGARPGDIIVVTANSAPPRRPLPACAEAMLRLLDSSGCDAPSLVWPKEPPPGRSARPR
jgi:selenophosphate synthetase-related protein